MFMGVLGCFFYYFVIGGYKSSKTKHKYFIFALRMQTEKVQINVRIPVDMWDKLAKIGLRKAMSVPQLTRYVLKKYLNDLNHDKQKTTANT